jgi:phosphoribosylformylglycinamidine cyclo-ligase
MNVTYRDVGDNYLRKDRIKKFAQISARRTATYLKNNGYAEESFSRGESAYVWRQGDIWMASVIEGLGTKNLVADAVGMGYECIGYDTVATIINDLTSVGATPLTIHAYWAVGDNIWFNNSKRYRALVAGWKLGCRDAGVSWGGGETPTLRGVITPGTIDLAGSAVGIISSKSQLISEKGLRDGDRILLLKSSGINANGVSLARTLAKEYRTNIGDGTTYGEALLQKTHIYASMLADLHKQKISIHYISNITGHGLRKLMRATASYTYVLERIIDPPVVFLFIQSKAKLSDYEMYQTFNMGMDYALFIDKKDVKSIQAIVKKHGFTSLDAGYMQKGKRQVVIEPKRLTYAGNSLSLR